MLLQDYDLVEGYEWFFCLYRYVGNSIVRQSFTSNINDKVKYYIDKIPINKLS